MLIRLRPPVRSALSLATDGAWSQATRLLRLHTSLGVDKLVPESVRGREALDENFRHIVTAVSTDAHLDLKRLTGKPVLLELLTAQSRTKYRPFHGHVTDVELLGADGGAARYRLTVEPWLSFLRHRQDTYVFQGLSVIQIIEAIFHDYVGEGSLVPTWRWELRAPSRYKPRSFVVQHEEDDLSFVLRLLAEEGLFFWFEHEGDSSAAPFGRHTLVIADHNGAFKTNPQARVQFKRADATESEDTLQHISSTRQLLTNGIEMASLDYRGVHTRPVADTSGVERGPEHFDLTAVDYPGQYAYADSAEGQRYARNQIEALDVRVRRYQMAGTLRDAGPGTSITVCGHPEFTGNDAHSKFAFVAVEYRATNNVSADHKAGLSGLFKSAARESAAL